MSPATIAKIEAGRVEKPRYSTMLKLAQGLKTAPESLMGLAEAEGPSAPEVRAVVAAGNTPERLADEAPQEPADQPVAQGERLSTAALQLVGMYRAGWRAAADPGSGTQEITRLHDEPRLGMSEAAFSGWGFGIPAMRTRVEFEAAMGRFGTPEELWKKMEDLARARGATEKDLDNFSKIHSPEALMREVREPGYLDGPEALGDPEVSASRDRVLKTLDSPGTGVDGGDLIKKYRGYVMRVRPEGLCAALGGLIVPGAENYDPVLDAYFGFNNGRMARSQREHVKRVAERLQIKEGVVKAYVTAVLEWYPFSEEEMWRAADASLERRYFWPDERVIHPTSRK